MKASAYFVRLATRAARPASGLRAACSAQALVLRAVVRLQPRGAPGADLRARLRSLAWQLRSRPQAAAVPSAASSIVLRHTERVQMFALSRIERVIQASSAPRLPELRLQPSVAAANASGAPTVNASAATTSATAINVAKNATAAKNATTNLLTSIRHTLHIQAGQWRQTWLRSATVNSRLVAALPSVQPSASPVPKQARAGESSAPAWLTPRLQKISQHHFSVIGRAPAAQQLLAAPIVGVVNANPAISSRAPLDFAATPALSTNLGSAPVRLDARSTLLPQRGAAMFYPSATQAKLNPSLVLPSRIAPSLRARAAAAAQPQQVATARAGDIEFASEFAGFSAPAAASVAAAVAQANAAADGLGAVAGAARFMPSSAFASAKPQTLLSAGTPSTPSARTPNQEQEWAQAVQRVIFTRHVLDKVTDDVVNKIEKRLRIERERRGI